MKDAEIERLERRLEEWSRRINELETAVSRGDAGQQASWRRDLEQLQAQRRGTQERLARLRLREAESWQQADLQAGVFRVFDNLGRRINRWLGRGP